ILVDASFGTVAGHLDGEEALEFFSYQNSGSIAVKPIHISVLASRCPICGADAKWLEDEVIHFCASCGRALVLNEESVQEHSYGYETSESSNTLYVPFWRFSLEILLKGKTYNNLGNFF